MESQSKSLWGTLRTLFAASVAAGLVSCAAGDLDGSGAPPLGDEPAVPPGQGVIMPAPAPDDPGGDPAAPGGPGAAPDAPNDGQERPYASRQLLVRFKSGTTQSLALASHQQHQAQVLRSYRLPSNLQLVELPEDVSVAQAIARYRQDPSVLYVQPNFQYRITERIPDDSQFSQLWGLHNTGFGSFDADIDAPEAWEITTGSNDVILGVLDTGIEYDHEDLFENVFSNPGEVPGNGQDDDGNGFADDIHGINAVEQHGDPRDDNGHGTHVSGTIAGRGDNGIGVAGVNWDAQIVSCKAFDAWGSGYEDAILSCMEYFLGLKTRTEDPVDILATNNSWGGGGFSQAMLDAIEAHRQAGMLFVAAAGNDWGNDNDVNPFYPASYELDNVIAVLATDYYDDRAYFSNYGRRSVDVGAPGLEILSTTQWGYEYYSGTSMATPHVTGLVGLLAAFDPSLGPSQLKNLILTGGDEVYGTQGITLSGRRINAFGSLTCEDRVLFNRFAPAAEHVAVSLGDSLPLGVLSIDCAQPNPTAQTVTVRETGEVIQLVDTSGTGNFQASFQPSDIGTFTLEFSMGDEITVDVAVNYDQARVVDYEYRDIEGTELPLYYYYDVTEFTSPFPIRFGHTDPGYQTIVVGSNGVISFTDYIASYYYASPLPVPYYQTVVAPLWMELSPGYSGGSVSYAVLGSAPNRELVIEWKNAPLWWGGSGVTFQVVFFENSPEILFSYADVEFENSSYASNGAYASVGVQVSNDVARQFSLYQPSLENEMTLLWSMGAPIAAAGPDQVVAPGDQVELDGSNSRDFDGEITFHAWDQLSGTPVLIDDANQAVARFVAPSASSTLTFQLSVIDDAGNVSTDTTNVIVNEAPRADAGDDFALANHLVGTLDGSGSSDVNGAIVGYSWRQVSGETVTLLGAGTAVATFIAPAQPQYLAFELTVRDEYGFTGTDLVLVEIFANDAPVASAGADRIVRPGGFATLDGSASHDPDGTIARYQWESTMCMTIAGPCVIDLIDADTATPTFEVPATTGLMHFRLTVTDDAGAVSSDTVSVVSFLQAPEAIIVPQGSCATSGSTLALDGSTSRDPDGDVVSYRWEQRGGTPVSFGNANAPVISFSVPASQQPLVFALTVTDDDGQSSTATITLPVNTTPVAVARVSSPAVLAGQGVILDGSQSQDVAGYQWSQLSGTPVSLSNAGGAVASFVAPSPTGPFEIASFGLTITDACGATDSDTVTVIIVRN